MTLDEIRIFLCFLICKIGTILCLPYMNVSKDETEFNIWESLRESALAQDKLCVRVGCCDLKAGRITSGCEGENFVQELAFEFAFELQRQLEYTGWGVSQVQSGMNAQTVFRSIDKNTGYVPENNRR